MDKRRPNYSRAFLVTAGLIGAINVGLFLYFLFLQEQPIGKGGSMIKPVPEWSLPFIVINFPGAVAAAPVWMARAGRDVGQAEEIALFAAMQIISTIFWGGVAVAVERIFVGPRQRAVTPPAPNLDAPPE